MIEGILVHKFLKFNLHNKFFQEQGSNPIYQHILFLNHVHTVYEELSIIIHINEYHFYHNMGKDILKRNIYLYYLHNFKYRFHIKDNHLHISLMCFKPTKDQDKLLHIFGLLYLYKLFV